MQRELTYNHKADVYIVCLKQKIRFVELKICVIFVAEDR